MITAAILRAVGASAVNAALYAPLMEHGRVVHGDSFKTITSKPGIAMVVSQFAHESGYYSTLSENLNYSATALKTLRNGQGIRYFTDEQADMYGYIKNKDGTYKQRADQRMIANLYYGGRLGNRGVDTNDGWDFRGSGLIQNTGLYNHTEFGKAVGLSPKDAAEYSRTPEGAVYVGFWYWRGHGLLVPASRGDVTECTRIIQGAAGGLTSRIALYKAARSALG